MEDVNMNKNPFCRCGCGERVSKPTNKYIWGHNKTVLSKKGLEKQRKRLKGKTYEELYGDRADERRKKLWKNREKYIPPNKGMTFEEFYGQEKSKDIKEKLLS